MQGAKKSWFSRTFELQDPHHARLLPMEGLRGIAVILVFLHHYSVQSELIGLAPGGAATIAAGLHHYGNMGVELFFVLSGYLIYGSLLRRQQPFTGFMARRLQRIYPTFLVVFALAIALILLMPGSGKLPSNPWAAAGIIAANMALLPGLFPITRIVQVAWSLSYEMFFYIAGGMLVLGTGFGRMAAPMRIVAIMLAALVLVLLSYLHIPHFPFRMMAFFAGMLLAEGIGGRIPAWLGWSAPLLAMIASITRMIPSVITEEVIHSIAFFLLCAVCFRDAGRVSVAMRFAPLRWLGNMSYSYYLLHGFIVRIAMVIIARFMPGGMPDWAYWTLMPILFGITLMASAMLFIIVEKPMSLQHDPSAMPRIRTLFGIVRQR